MAADLVFSRAHAPYPAGAAIVFGEDVVAALRALVLRFGVISQSRIGEEGVYPALRVSAAGSLVAGGTGADLVVENGAFRQVRDGEVTAS